MKRPQSRELAERYKREGVKLWRCPNCKYAPVLDPGFHDLPEYETDCCPECGIQWTGAVIA